MKQQGCHIFLHLLFGEKSQIYFNSVTTKAREKMSKALESLELWEKCSVF
jgi:hypothetical protein